MTSKSFKIIGITDISIKKILELEKPSDALALYVAYYEVAQWQDTYIVKATNDFMMKRLQIGKTRFYFAKNQLLELGLINNIVKTDEKCVITAHYIEIKHLVKGSTLPKTDTVDNRDNSINPHSRKSTLPKTDTVDFRDTNTHNNKLNAHNNKESALKIEKKHKSLLKQQKKEIDNKDTNPKTSNLSDLNSKDDESINEIKKIKNSTAKSSRKVLFVNSKYNELKNVVDAFMRMKENDRKNYGGAYLPYYMELVKDWSDSSDTKRTDRGWFATIKQFIRRDKVADKLITKAIFKNKFEKKKINRSNSGLLD